MDDEPVLPREEQKDKPIEKKRRKTFLLGLLILLLVAAAAGAGYWIRDRSARTTENQQAATITSLQQTSANLKNQFVAEKAKNTTTETSKATACTPKAPSIAAISNIEASITSGNTAALEGYMASSVNVIFAASEGLGTRTSPQAVSDITGFISPIASSWDYDFSLSASVLSSYGKGSYGQYFPGTAVVGKATNKQVIAFSFDCNGKIK
jgi:cytoskeletal protein RodZ